MLLNLMLNYSVVVKIDVVVVEEGDVDVVKHQSEINHFDDDVNDE